jgi:hypothetical protein
MTVNGAVQLYAAVTGKLTKCISTSNYLFMLRDLLKLHTRNIEQTLESEWWPDK